MGCGDRSVTLIEEYRITTHGTAGNCSRTHKSKPKQKGNRDVDQLSHVDQRILLNCESQLNTFEDNEAVIKMIVKGRSPTMRHVSRTHRVALDWLLDRINLEPKIRIKKVDTKDQLADILTKEVSRKMNGITSCVCPR